MSEINWSIVSAVISSITAVIAIAAPVVTSILSASSQERMKKMELYTPRVYDALAEMSLRYSRLIRRSTAFNDAEAQRLEYLEALNRYQEFMAASYTVMSLVPGENIQQQISRLVVSLDGPCSPRADHDMLFCQLMNDIHAYMRTSKVKQQVKHAKGKI